MNIAGKYDTQHQEVTIFQDGNSITARYQEKGQVEGKLEGMEVTGTWVNGAGSGLFKWTFDADGNFNGVYKSGMEPGPMRGKWNGTRIGSAAPSPVEVSAPVLEAPVSAPVGVATSTPASLATPANETVVGPGPDGKFTDPEGTVYEGKWAGNQFVSGKATEADGSVSEGEFKDFALHGKGKYTYSEIVKDEEDPEDEGEEAETVMDGNWSEGVMVSGKVFIDGDLYEDGEFNEDGDLQGRGRRDNGDGDYEEGTFEQGELIKGKVRSTDEDGNVYEGESSDGAWNGMGKYTYEDGTFYSGEFNTNAFTGQGKYQEPNGDWKNGTWENDEFVEGRIRETDEDGNVYEGGYALEGRNGRGKLTFVSGSYYEGEFLDGNYDGRGKFVYSDGDWKEGKWENDNFIEGKVKLVLENATYEGEMKNDMYHGQGKLVYNSGNVYEGEFQDNEMHGKGKFTYGDGSGYRDGLFQNDAFVSGKSNRTFSDGGSYEGDIVDRDWTGKGKRVYPNGNVYDGEWLDNVYHGKGRLDKTNGDFEDGTWENGQFVEGDVRKTEADGSWYEGMWAEGIPNVLGRWENPKTGEFKDGMWDEDGFYSGEMRLLVNGKLQDLDGITWFVDNAWAKEKERLKIEEVKQARIAAEREAERQKAQKEREKVEAAAAKEREKAQKEREKANAANDKEREKAAKAREAEQKKKDAEKKKKDAEREKTKSRYFNIHYKIKLTKAKSSTHYKGEEFGMIGIVFNGGKTKQVKTHDKGESIERKIRISHEGQSIPSSLVKHYIEKNDADVKAGRAGTSTIVVISVKEA
jgi:hypothetical protein